MSDLISRSKLINDIATYFFSDKCNLDRLGGDLREIINNQPTAYSVDKVVEELEERQQEYLAGFGVQDINEAYGVARGLGDAIEIVKQGAVSDDACEKMQMQAYNKAVDNCLKILYFHQNEYDGIQWAIREIEELKEMERD